MAVTQSAVTTCKMLVGGKWVDSSVKEFTNVCNPSTGEIIAKVPVGNKQDVDRAVQAGQKAFESWREVPVVERARVMFKFKALLEQNYDNIAQSVSREHGKTIAEAKASVFRGIEVVEFACGIPSLMMGECL